MKWEPEELKFLEDNRDLIEAQNIVELDKKIYKDYSFSYKGIGYNGANSLYLALAYVIYGAKEFTIKTRGQGDIRPYLYLPEKYINNLTYYKRVFDGSGYIHSGEIITDLSEVNCRKSLMAYPYWNARIVDLVSEIIKEAKFIG